MGTPALNPLVEKIRAAHPGAYDDMDDATLTKKVLAKYPQYSDLAGPGIQKPQVNMQPVAEGLEHDPNQGNPMGGLPGAWGNREMTGKDLVPGAIVGGTAGAIMGGSLAAPLVKPILKEAPKYVARIAAAEGIRRARQIPYVGKLIPPGSELLPFLIGGKGESEPPPEGAPPPDEIIPPIERPAEPPQQSPGDAILSKMRPYYDKLEAEGHGEQAPPEEETPQTIMGDDLTPALKKSLDKVKAAKASARSK